MKKSVFKDLFEAHQEVLNVFEGVAQVLRINWLDSEIIYTVRLNATGFTKIYRYFELHDGVYFDSKDTQETIEKKEKLKIDLINALEERA